MGDIDIHILWYIHQFACQNINAKEEEEEESVNKQTESKK